MIDEATYGPACTYDQHRSSDWLSRDVGLITCGICHPPLGVPDELTARRGAPDFDELATGTAGGFMRLKVIAEAEV